LIPERPGAHSRYGRGEAEARVGRRAAEKAGIAGGGARAAARRAARDRTAAPRPPESAGSGKPDPVRYGDWEINGIATDF
jgi:hypothetical protein